MLTPFTATSCFTMSCADTQSGATVTRCYQASSILSQADADKKAEAGAQQTAYAALQCEFLPNPETPVFYNLPLSGARVCTNCSGSTSTPVAVAAATFFSFESQAVADAAAAALLAQLENTSDCPPAFYNTYQSYTAYCAPGSTGSEFSSFAAPGSFCSMVSQEDANAIGLAAARANAEAGLTCTTVYWNELVSVTLTCAVSSPDPSKLKGPPVTATIPAGLYSSTSSQASANAAATAAATIAAAAQLACYTYGNVLVESNGGATPDCSSVYGSSYVGPSGSVVEVAANQYFSDASQGAADALAQAAADADYASSLNCQYVE